MNQTYNCVSYRNWVGDYTIDFDEGTNVKLQHGQAM